MRVGNARAPGEVPPDDVYLPGEPLPPLHPGHLRRALQLDEDGAAHHGHLPGSRNKRRDSQRAWYGF